MLTVTPAARERLVAMLQEAPEAAVVRIVFGFRGLEFQCSAVFPGDTTFSHEGRIVLAMDRHLTDALRDKTLDMRDTPEGRILDLS